MTSEVIEDEATDSTERPRPVKPAGPDDGFLFAAVAASDASALRILMARYDRLVRYAIFRRAKTLCLRDPHFLDSVAGDAWTGFVQCARRAPDDPPRSVKAFLVRIATNRCISALRRRDATSAGTSTDPGTIEAEATMEEPSELLSAVELLEGLRGCMEALGDEEQRLAGELDAITGRRWKEAAGRLGMSESTLRSRWARVLDQLRDCVAGKTGQDLAPEDLGGD